MPQKETIRLSIEAGTELTLAVEGIQGRIKCNLIGIKPDAYLIAEISPSGIADDLLESKRVIVRFLYFGNIYGFRSMTLKTIAKPSRLLFLVYPESVESHNLRKKDRVRCYTSLQRLE